MRIHALDDLGAFSVAPLDPAELATLDGGSTAPPAADDRWCLSCFFGQCSSGPLKRTDELAF